MAVSYENWNWRRNEILFRNLKIIIVKQFFETWIKIFDTPSIISNIKISSPSILLFNLLSKLIFPREFSSQKKKIGNKGKTSFPRRSISILPDGSPNAGSPRAFELVQSLSNPPRHCSFDFDPVNGARNFKAFRGSTRFIYLLSSTS